MAASAAFERSSMRGSCGLTFLFFLTLFLGGGAFRTTFLGGAAFRATFLGGAAFRVGFLGGATF